MVKLSTKVILTVCLPIVLILFNISNVHCMTIQEELQLSKKIMKQIEKKFELVKDTEINNYVNAVGSKLINVVEDNIFDYNFHVINDHNLNAFTIPGGHVFVNTGLISVLKSEEELAGILAHEIAHISCRHIAKIVGKTSKVNLATLAVIVAGILTSRHAEEAAIIGMQTAFGITSSLPAMYSRENEQQADVLGVNYLKKAGYTGRGLIESIQTIQSLKLDSSNDKVLAYLNTHPSFEERLTYLSSVLNQWDSSTAEAETNTKIFDFFKTKIVALYESENFASNKFETILEIRPDDDIANYGVAFLAIRSKDWTKAVCHLEKVIKLNPLNDALHCELGKIYFKDNQYDKALPLLKDCTADMEPEGAFYLALMQIESGELEKAEKNLSSLIELNRHNNDAYFFLSKVYAMRKDTAKTYYNLGMYHWKKKDFKKALIQFEKTLSFEQSANWIEKIKKTIKEVKTDARSSYEAE